MSDSLAGNLATVLHLDDDSGILEDVAKFLKLNGYRVLSALNVAVAKVHLQRERVDFAVVDLFLEGDDGEELSNEFVRGELHPRAIPYLRMTSAPGLVPPDAVGCAVLPKATFRKEPEQLLKLLSETLGS